MKILILGAGQVGSSAAYHLSREEANDVTVVDRRPDVLRELQDRLDIRTVVGHAAYPDVLDRAGANDADIVVALTDTDETNMIACQIAYTMFHTPTKIARIRSAEYMNSKDLFAQDAIPIDVRISPEQLVCEYIEQLILYPGASQVLDFAGGTVVHINAGVAGLVAAIVLGRRKGYGQENMAPHNLTLTVIGASLLWVGWFGFNAGSALAADSSAGMAMTVTQIATAAAALTWMFSEWLVHGKPSILGIASGAIAGLVAITPASGFVDPKGALIIGLAAGIGCYIFSTGIKRALGYDDSLDVFGVHGVGGIIGALLTGVFVVEAIGGTAGLLEGNFAQVPIQVYGVAATVIWSGVATFVILMVLKAIMGIRVTDAQELEGLDVALHDEALH